jgi:hypothetical protein
MKRRTVLKLGAGTALSGALAACGGNDDGGSDPVSTPAGPPAQANAVIGWTQTALQAVRATRPGPTVVARSMAIMYTCMYNTWCAYDTLARPTRPGQPARRPPSERTAANKAMAMSFAAHAALLDQFPGEKPAFDAYLKSLGYDPAQASADPGMPPGLGAAVARIEIDYCHTDGANQLGDLAPGGVPYADYTGYVPKNPPMIVGAPTPPDLVRTPSNWQPLTYTDAAGVVRTPVFTGAAWSRVRPFALASSDQYRPGPPVAFGTAEYEEQARRVVELQAGLTEEQKVIADYWADGPNSEFPPGHWLLHAIFVSERDRHTDDDDVRMFFALSDGDRRLGRQARLRLGAPHHGGALPDAWPDHHGIWAVGAGRWAAPDSGRDLGPVSAAHVSDAGLSGIRVGTQHLQRSRGRGAQALHGKRRLRRPLRQAGANDDDRTQPSRKRPASRLGDLQRSGQAGWPVAHLRRHPLRQGQHGRTNAGAPGSEAGVCQGAGALVRRGMKFMRPGRGWHAVGPATADCARAFTKLKN